MCVCCVLVCVSCVRVCVSVTGSQRVSKSEVHKIDSRVRTVGCKSMHSLGDYTSSIKTFVAEASKGSPREQ